LSKKNFLPIILAPTLVKNRHFSPSDLSVLHRQVLSIIFYSLATLCSMEPTPRFSRRFLCLLLEKNVKFNRIQDKYQSKVTIIVVSDTRMKTSIFLWDFYRGGASRLLLITVTWLYWNISFLKRFYQRKKQHLSLLLIYIALNNHLSFRDWWN